MREGDLQTHAGTWLDGARGNLIDSRNFGDGVPHDVFDELRRDRPLHPNYAPDGRRIWSLTRYSDIRAVSTDQARFTSNFGVTYQALPAAKDAYASNVVFADPPVHTRLRHFFNLGFSPRVVQHFESWIREIARDIISDIVRRPRFDFVTFVAAVLPSLVIARILGLPQDERHLMIAWANDGVAGGDGDETAALKAQRVNAELYEYALKMREVKRRKPGEDMITMLANADYDGVRMTDEEYMHFVMITMIAGYETTHTALAQSMLFYLNNPEVYREVTSGGTETLVGANEELLRWITPAMHMMRTTKEDVTLHGLTIPKGESVILWFVAANHDPGVFDDPHRVDIRRKNRAHAAFGAGGPHVCIGNRLARLEIQIMFEELIRSGVKLELDCDPVRMSSVLINGLKSLPVLQVN